MKVCSISTVTESAAIAPPVPTVIWLEMPAGCASGMARSGESSTCTLSGFGAGAGGVGGTPPPPGTGSGAGGVKSATMPLSDARIDCAFGPMPRAAKTSHAPFIAVACAAGVIRPAARRLSITARIASRASRKDGLEGVTLRASTTSCSARLRPMRRFRSISVAHHSSPMLCTRS